MSQPTEQDALASTDRFAWHPRYGGKTLQQVADALREELERDQRAYRLALEGAEEHEHEVLAAVLDLEKKWGTFDLDWSIAEPVELAGKIAAYEMECDRRRELLAYQDFRERAAATQQVGRTSRRPWWAFWQRSP